MQSQLLIEPEQAPDIPSPCKNKSNIEEDACSFAEHRGKKQREFPKF